MVTGELTDWVEYSAAGLVTVRSDSGDLLYLETNSQEGVSSYSLVKVKIGSYSTIHKG